MPCSSRCTCRSSREPACILRVDMPSRGCQKAIPKRRASTACHPFLSMIRPEAAIPSRKRLRTVAPATPDRCSAPATILNDTLCSLGKVLLDNRLDTCRVAPHSTYRVDWTTSTSSASLKDAQSWTLWHGCDRSLGENLAWTVPRVHGRLRSVRMPSAFRAAAISRSVRRCTTNMRYRRRTTSTSSGGPASSTTRSGSEDSFARFDGGIAFGWRCSSANWRRNPYPAAPPLTEAKTYQPALPFREDLGGESSRLYSPAIARFMLLMMVALRLPSFSNFARRNSGL